MSLKVQSVLMALMVTVNTYAFSNVQAVRRNESKGIFINVSDVGRRGLLFSSSFLAAASSGDQLLQKYLKKSEENKAKNDKERLESYYRRNYKDYFELLEGPIKGKEEQQLTESEKAIIDWLKSNR